MQRDERAWLLDMLVSAREALALAAGLSYAEFAEDRRSQLAILKSVETVGEAASRVSEDTREAHPQIPWRETVGMRHRLIHAYFDIDLRLVWDTVGPPGVDRPVGAVVPAGRHGR